MKRAVLLMSDVCLVNFCKMLEDRPIYGFKVVKNGLPIDAKPIRTFRLGRAEYTGECGEIGILIESESFEDIEEGCEYPILDQVQFKIIEQTQNLNERID